MHYLAYGSNLHPIRLRERAPSARLVGITALPGYQLAFHKRGRDGSGKCDLVGATAHHRRAFGAIYSIDPREKPLLDIAEGNGRGYLACPITVVHEAAAYRCFTYRAQPSQVAQHLSPYHWYKEFVL
jgi:hypothetical protein